VVKLHERIDGLGWEGAQQLYQQLQAPREQRAWREDLKLPRSAIHRGAPCPPNEAERLNALLSYDILDTEPEESFTEITEMVKQVFDVDIAAVSLVDKDRQVSAAELITCTVV
jgi:hypothetical protein